MSIHVKRLSVIAGLGALLAMAGCDSNSSYDHRYDDYSYDRYPSSDRNSAYERGYRDGERASFNQNYNSRDYREGYDRGRKETKRDSKERSRDRSDYRHSNEAQYGFRVVS